MLCDEECSDEKVVGVTRRLDIQVLYSGMIQEYTGAEQSACFPSQGQLGTSLYNMLEGAAWPHAGDLNRPAR